MECFLCKDMSENERCKLTEMLGEVCTFAKGEELYRSGSLGFLLTGSARIVRLSEGGRATTVRNITSGECFGAASVFGSWQGRSSIIALENCTVRYADDTLLSEIFTIYPQAALNYISYLSDRIRFLNRRMDTFSAENAEQKLYEFLLSLANSGVVELPFGMAELARRLKMGRSSVYRSLEVLEQNGMIRREKKKFIIL